MSQEPLTNEQRDFVAQNLGLAGCFVKLVLRRRAWLERHRDDIMQVVVVGLIKAAKVFQPDRGAFGTIASFCVRRELAKYWAAVSPIPAPQNDSRFSERSRKAARRARKQMRSLDDVVIVDGHKTSLHETIANARYVPSLEELENRVLVRRALGRLRERDRKVLQARFMQGLTMEDTGRQFGLTKERIRQIEARALRDLKVELENAR